MPESPMVGARVPQDWQQQIQEIAGEQVTFRMSKNA